MTATIDFIGAFAKRHSDNLIAENKLRELQRDNTRLRFQLSAALEWIKKNNGAGKAEIVDLIEGKAQER